jgi:hypothetical protein
MMTANGLERLELAALGGAPVEVEVDVGAELVLDDRRVEVRTVVDDSVSEEVEADEVVTEDDSVLVVDWVDSVLLLEGAEVVDMLVEEAVDTVAEAVTSETKTNRSE